jgi:hypothetical protein
LVGVPVGVDVRVLVELGVPVVVDVMVPIELGVPVGVVVGVLVGVSVDRFAGLAVGSCGAGVFVAVSVAEAVRGDSAMAGATNSGVATATSIASSNVQNPDATRGTRSRSSSSRHLRRRRVGESSAI